MKGYSELFCWSPSASAAWRLDARASTGRLIASPDKATRLTLLFTNDVESAYDPIPAFWLDDVSTDRRHCRDYDADRIDTRTEPNVFLFDSGDIFTGALAKLTQGRLAFELMITMGYDAMAIGNHEFEYGHKIFRVGEKPGAVSGARRQLFLQGHRSSRMRRRTRSSSATACALASSASWARMRNGDHSLLHRAARRT